MFNVHRFKLIQFYAHAREWRERSEDGRIEKVRAREQDMKKDRQTERRRGKTGKGGDRQSEGRTESLLVGWLVNVPATCKCISWMDLLRQFYVLPH